MPSLYSFETIKYLTKPEIQKLLEVTKDNIRNHALFNLAYCHGLRVSEVSLLQIEDYNLENKRIRTRRLKNGINATYLTSDESHKALVKWIKIRGNTPGPLFPSRESNLESGERGISRFQLDTIFKQYAEKANISDKTKCHFHVLRHSVAVHMVEANIPLVKIQDWLGHRSIQSTMIYARVSDYGRDQTAEQFFKWKEEQDKKSNLSLINQLTNGKIKTIDEYQKEQVIKAKKKENKIDWGKVSKK